MCAVDACYQWTVDVVSIVDIQIIDFRLSVEKVDFKCDDLREETAKLCASVAAVPKLLA